MNIDVTNLILGLMTLLGCCGWFVSGRKHKQEVESLRADNHQKYLDLGTDFVEKFNVLIAKPLEAEVKNLRTEVNRLRNAIEKVNDCPSRSTCPVRKQLHYEQESHQQ